ncbi:MAG TPA: 2-C-methyl-D-erythritol 4-phosphate cytidylyltransferase [Candidimonas sp.]|nr:2-C-methyl-D-erythritol 4-phosphate cytidylyltransferase [Candidimonas sp.]
MHTKLIAIVPAAGIGARALAADSAAAPKQYRLLRGEPMLRWAVKALLADERIAQVRVAIAAGDIWAEQALDGLPRTVWRACGGPDRAATVTAALLDAGQDGMLASGDWVLVHDAARPGLPQDALQRLIDRCLTHGAGGLLAQPVADTVKRAAAGQAAPKVQTSIARDGLWLAQTPQMFLADELLTALRHARLGHAIITDEASAMELLGHTPQLVQGSARNFKVTWPEDFDLMEKWL